jgi:type VI secretion system protein ImpL
VRQTCSASKYTNNVGPVLEQPLRFAWSALMRDLGTQIDAKWKVQIAEPFRREVEPMFPFNPNGQDLPLAILSKYFRPNDGVLWTFGEKEMRAFQPQTGYLPGPAGLFTVRLAFSRDYLEFMERARAIREALYSGSGAEPSVVFDITPIGTEDVTESILEIDGQPPLRYRNELPTPTTFTWPGKPGPPQARLSIAVTRSAERPGIPMITGEWAFFRLLQRAKIDAQSTTSFQLTWTPPSSDPRKLSVRYRLQARGASSPFAAGFFRGIRCPERVSEGGSPVVTPAAVAR